MSTSRSLTIVVDSQDRYRSVPYQFKAVAEEWRRNGGRVSVVDRPDAVIDSDLVIAHVDLTVTPESYRRAFAGHRRVLNAAVTDISKRRISRNLVTSPDEWDGPVIIKTDLNHGGWPELDRFRERGMAARVLGKLVRRAPWQVTGMLAAANYPVFPHPRHVPWYVWRHPRLVVEKLRPERRGDLYCLRQHIFLGDCAIDTIVYAHHPVVKASNIVRRETLDGPPPEILALRREFGFDFGKFDYAISDGEVVIYDVNRTPSFGDDPEGRERHTAQVLTPGLTAYLA